MFPIILTFFFLISYSLSSNPHSRKQITVNHLYDDKKFVEMSWLENLFALNSGDIYQKASYFHRHLKTDASNVHPATLHSETNENLKILTTGILLRLDLNLWRKTFTKKGLKDLISIDVLNPNVEGSTMIVKYLWQGLNHYKYLMRVNYANTHEFQYLWKVGDDYEPNYGISICNEMSSINVLHSRFDDIIDLSYIANVEDIANEVHIYEHRIFESIHRKHLARKNLNGFIQNIALYLQDLQISLAISQFMLSEVCIQVNIGLNNTAATRTPVENLSFPEINDLISRIKDVLDMSLKSSSLTAEKIFNSSLELFEVISTFLSPRCNQESEDLYSNDSYHSFIHSKHFKVSSPAFIPPLEGEVDEDEDIGMDIEQFSLCDMIIHSVSNKASSSSTTAVPLAIAKRPIAKLALFDYVNSTLLHLLEREHASFYPSCISQYYESRYSSRNRDRDMSSKPNASKPYNADHDMHLADNTEYLYGGNNFTAGTVTPYDRIQNHFSPQNDKWECCKRVEGMVWKKRFINNSHYLTEGAELMVLTMEPLLPFPFEPKYSTQLGWISIFTTDISNNTNYNQSSTSNDAFNEILHRKNEGSFSFSAMNCSKRIHKSTQSIGSSLYHIPLSYTHPSLLQHVSYPEKSVLENFVVDRIPDMCEVVHDDHHSTYISILVAVVMPISAIKSLPISELSQVSALHTDTLTQFPFHFNSNVLSNKVCNCTVFHNISDFEIQWQNHKSKNRDKNDFLLPPCPRILLLGLGGGTLHSFLIRHHFCVSIVSVELHTHMVSVARRSFALDSSVCAYYDSLTDDVDAWSEPESGSDGSIASTATTAASDTAGDDYRKVCRSTVVTADAFEFISELRDKIEKLTNKLKYLKTHVSANNDEFKDFEDESCISSIVNCDAANSNYTNEEEENEEEIFRLEYMLKVMSYDVIISDVFDIGGITTFWDGFKGSGQSNGMFFHSYASSNLTDTSVRNDTSSSSSSPGGSMVVRSAGKYEFLDNLKTLTSFGTENGTIAVYLHYDSIYDDFLTKVAAFFGSENIIELVVSINAAIIVIRSDGFKSGGSGDGKAEVESVHRDSGNDARNGNHDWWGMGKEQRCESILDFSDSMLRYGRVYGHELKSYLTRFCLRC